MAAVMLTTAAAAQQAPQPAQPSSVPQPGDASAPQQPPKPPAPPIPGTVTCPAPTPPATAPTRMFNAPAGMLVLPVTSTRVADFEKFLGYVRDALAKTTDPTLLRQAKGWKSFRASEPGANNDVLYVFVFDPAVPCVDYGFGPILAAAIPDEAKLAEIWNLYKLSVKSGGSLMNFVPVPAPDSKPTRPTP
jgi:hypothetical protein